MTYDKSDWHNLCYTYAQKDIPSFNVLFRETIDRIAVNTEHYESAKFYLEEYCANGLGGRLLESILALVRLEPDSPNYKVMLFSAATAAGSWDLAIAVVGSNIGNPWFRSALTSIVAESWSKLTADSPNLFRELLFAKILSGTQPTAGHDHLSAFAHALSGHHISESELSALARPEYGPRAMALVAHIYQERYEWMKAIQVWSDIRKLDSDYPNVDACMRSAICRTCSSPGELMTLLGSLADHPQLRYAIKFAQFHHIILIKGHRAAYVVNPKVGSTSILSRIFVANGGDSCDPSQFYLETKVLARLDEQPIDVIDEVLSSPEWMRFSFVRHPVHRFVSGYLNKFTRLFAAPNASFAFLQAAGISAGIPQFVPVNSRSDYEIGDLVSFLENHESQDLDMHFSRQSDLLGLERINYGFIGKFEEFDKHLKLISDAIGVDLTSSAKASHRTDSTNYVNHVLDAALRRRITSYYRKDFENFGYIGAADHTDAAPGAELPSSNGYRKKT